MTWADMAEVMELRTEIVFMFWQKSFGRVRILRSRDWGRTFARLVSGLRLDKASSFIRKDQRNGVNLML